MDFSSSGEGNRVNNYNSINNLSIQTLTDNYKRICNNVAEAKAKYRGSGDIVRIMAVTKTVAPEIINSAIELGIDLIGENRVQEYLSKKDMYMPCEMHIIGHLQTNKVKFIINDASMIQSVDSIRLASEIDRLAYKNDKVMDILAEVNICDEGSKSGIAKDELFERLEQFSELKNIRLRGLMAIPPANCDESVFADMQGIYEDMKSKLSSECFDTLSVGMSGDYELAIKHGSTLVRLGTALFGARNYFI